MARTKQTARKPAERKVVRQLPPHPAMSEDYDRKQQAKKEKDEKRLQAKLKRQQKLKARQSRFGSDTLAFYEPKGDGYELSNYSPLKDAKLTLFDIEFSSSEAMFQAGKFIYEGAPEAHFEYARLIAKQNTPNKARVLAMQRTGGGYKWRTELNPLIERYQDSVKIRPDWAQVKDRVMFYCLVQKFKRSAHHQRFLLGTGTKTLVEDSPRDAYWGIATSGDGKSGKNRLGELLMVVRSVLEPLIENKLDMDVPYPAKLEATEVSVEQSKKETVGASSANKKKKKEKKKKKKKKADEDDAHQHQSHFVRLLNKHAARNGITLSASDRRNQLALLHGFMY